MELKALIIEEAGKVDEVMRQDIDGLAADFDPLLIDILNYALFGGGKRIRPFLTILAARFCGCRTGNSSVSTRRSRSIECLPNAVVPPGS